MNVKKQLKKEAVVTIAIYLLYFAWWYIFGYGMGDRDPNEYKYILGLPDWFFYSVILGFIVISTIINVAVKYFFKEIQFEDENKKLGGVKNEY